MSRELPGLRFSENRAVGRADSQEKTPEDPADPEIPVFKIESGVIGHVFLTGEAVTFGFSILSGKTGGNAKWVVIQDDNQGPAVITSRGLDIPLSKAAGSITDTYTYFTVRFDPLSKTQYLGHEMFIVLTDDTSSVSFASPVFSVAEPEERIEVSNKLQAVKGKEGGTTEEGSPWNLTVDAGMPTTITTGSTPTTTLGPADRSNAPSIDGSAHNGLSTAAKAGIGAGVGVVGLILIGLAVWFLLRRRRRGHQAAGAAGDDTSVTPATGFMRDDKDSHAARVADSPHSPISDDERVRDSAVLAGDAGEPSSTHAPSPTTEQRDVPSAMAHLVEDGMTDAEIRRLEEEERALDQAIEQAGRR